MRAGHSRQQILARAALFLAALIAVGLPHIGLAADAAPKEKDTRQKSWPKEAAFTTSVSPAEAKPGERVTYTVSVKLAPTWHIYRFAVKQPDNGPRNTEFDFFDTAGLKLTGDWKPGREPIRKDESAIWGPGLPFVEFYEDEARWSIPLEIPAGTEPGEKSLRCQIFFQICNPKSCKSPTYETLPAVALKVLPGGAAAPAATNENPPAVEQAPARAPVSTAANPSPSSSSSAPSIATTAAGSASSTPATNDVQRALSQGLLPFLLLSIGGGLLALVMPCVWPMVPITVNFFVKQGEKRKGKTLGLAITYCVAIIVVFTLVGVVCSAAFGAAALQNFATGFWLNLVIAVLFIAFGLSLLGFYEIGLPTFLLNLTARGESRGGLVGVIFMALTLTISSFTCTFPVVGGLIAMAAGGKFFYPVIGLATFATVLALPFFLLALAPGLLSRVPKSGDWMNAVKIVGGLTEIGAALKFVNNAECAFVTPENAFFNAPTVLTIWIVLAVVCGLYLLGVFKTAHDHDAVKVGPGRLLCGTVFLFLALFLAPALFGRPPQSKVWDLLVGLLPNDVESLTRGAAGSGLAASEGGRVKATSHDPKVAEREETTFHGVSWGMSYEAALERARQENRPVFVDFTGVWCANCRQMEQSVFPRPEVVDLLGKFVTVQLFTDQVPIDSITAGQRTQLAYDNQDLRSKLTNEETNPVYVVLTPQGKVLKVIGGSQPASVFVNFLQAGLAKYNEGNKVAQAEGAAGK